MVWRTDFGSWQAGNLGQGEEMRQGNNRWDQITQAKHHESKYWGMDNVSPELGVLDDWVLIIEMRKRGYLVQPDHRVNDGLMSANIPYGWRWVEWWRYLRHGIKPTYADRQS